MQHRRDGEHQVDLAAVLAEEYALDVAEAPAAKRLVKGIVPGRDQIFDGLADDLRRLKAQEPFRRTIGKLNAAVAIADEQRIGHGSNDLLRRERGSDGDE